MGTVVTVVYELWLIELPYMIFFLEWDRGNMLKYIFYSCRSDINDFD